MPAARPPCRLRASAILDPPRRPAAGSAKAARERIGPERIYLGWSCTAAEQDGEGATLHFRDPSGKPLPPRRAAVAIACDGIHSVVRKQFFPDEGPPRYSGVNMWRGTTRWQPFLSGANMVRAGWLATGKMVIYPIRDAIDTDGRQLVNWVAEIETRTIAGATGTAPAISTMSCPPSPTGISTGSTCRRSFAPPTWCSNFRWWIRTRCRAGATAG